MGKLTEWPNNYNQYNGKEVVLRNNLEWNDYGARYYDPQIGRWHAEDPMAEKYYSSTPYSYADNDPVNKVDPTGMDWYKANGSDDASGESYKWIEGNEEQEGYEHIGQHLVISPNKNTMMFFSGQKFAGTIKLDSDQGK